MITRITTRGAGFAEVYKGRSRGLSDSRVREQLRQVGNEVRAEYIRNIESFTPGRAPDLSPKYKAIKEKKVGFAYPILLRTGAFIASMYSRVVHSGRTWTISIGFAGRHPDGPMNADIARWHISGAGNNPVRDFTRLTSAFVQYIRGRVQAVMHL